MSFLRILAIAALTLIAACAQPPAPDETLQSLRYDSVSVAFNADAREALSREIDEAAFGAQIKEAAMAALAGFQGVRSAHADIQVTFYTLPKSGAALVPFATIVPTLFTTVSLKDATTGEPIGEPTQINVNYASAGNLLVGSGAVSESAEQASQIVSEYRTALRERLSPASE